MEQSPEIGHLPRVAPVLDVNQWPSLQEGREWEGIVHAVVWNVGRRFGFQAFNRDPEKRKLKQEHHRGWVPSTLFVVSDHLTNLIVRNAFLRDKLGGESKERFARAVFEVHTEIFCVYRNHWTKHVGFPVRLKESQNDLNSKGYADDQAVNILLSELALWFLLWTESANMRHTPEALWWYYWAASFSPEFDAVCREGYPRSLLDPSALAVNSHTVRDRRQRLRNKYQSAITDIHQRIGLRPEHTRPTLLRQQLDAVVRSSAFAKLKVEGDDRELLVDLLLFGDGGQFTDWVIQPVFSVFAYEIQKLGVIEAVENSQRLGYDDVNESFILPHAIRNTMKKLQVDWKTVKSAQPNNTLQNLIQKGCRDGAEVEEGFDQMQVMRWYRKDIFVKTFLERRSWFMVLRSFYRVFSFLICAFHLQFIIAFNGFKLEEIGGVAVTHSFIQALERTANRFVTRNRKNPWQRRQDLESWTRGEDGKNTKKNKNKKKKTEADPEESAPKGPVEEMSTDQRPFFGLEGAPILGWFGVIEYWGLFLAILVCYLSRHSGPLSSMMKNLWKFIGLGYVGVVVFHEVITTRDGYQVSLTQGLIKLPFLTAYTARPAPQSYLLGNMKVGWNVFFVNMIYWVFVFIVKFGFDYNFLIKPLVNPVRALQRKNWLSNCPVSIPGVNIGEDTFAKANMEMFGIKLPIKCFDGDYLLIAVRLLPFFLVSLVDTSVANQLVLTAFGVLRGLLSLNLGLVGRWDDIVREFHRAPANYWNKCVSEEGKKNQLIALQLAKGNVNLPAEIEEDTKGKKAARKKKKDDLKKNQITMLRNDKVLSDLSDENIARWRAFSEIWDQVIEDLREGDIISNSEKKNLKFVHLDPTVQESSVRPILLPAFYYAGQIQKVVDRGVVSAFQIPILIEFRTLMVWILSSLGVLTSEEQLKLCTEAVLLESPIDLAHRKARRALFDNTKKFLHALAALERSVDTTVDAHHKEEVKKNLRSSLQNVVGNLITEFHACNSNKGRKLMARTEKNNRVKGEKRKKKDKNAETNATAMITLLTDLRDNVLNNNDEMKVVIMRMSENLLNSNSSYLISKVIKVANNMLNLTHVSTKPRNPEACRILQFFMSSLSNPQLPNTPALSDVMSHTVLTPVYNEDVLYPYERKEALRPFRMRDAEKLQPDLVTESEDKVSLMAYLRSVFPEDWSNFKERMSDELGRDMSNLHEDNFADGQALHEYQLQLQLWASYRGQLLARTIRGMFAFDKALRVLARLEYPCPPGMSSRQYRDWIDELVKAKFSYVCSCQTYGENRIRRDDPKLRWNAEAVEVLLGYFHKLTVAFLDTADTDRGKTQYSVLVRGNPNWRRETTGKMTTDRVVEIYRVRIPQHSYSNRGIIIGEGKPENQNHAVIFAFGEGLQAIDMNQDNHLCEALKMRNLLGELRRDDEIWKNSPDKKIRKRSRAVKEEDFAKLNTASKVEDRMSKYKATAQPIGLVGHREWIFSDVSGALGSFAASAEFAFGTIVQRVLSYPGRSRMHYGHPDTFYKLYSMTRGGMSKATKTLHISEDVFGGLNHTLRGSRFKYREYISVGKGRDMGFDTINAFEIKISGGNGEVCISRDVARLGARMDFFRLMAFYHSGPGYYINTFFLMLSVWAQLWVITFFALAKAGVLQTPLDCDQLGLSPYDCQVKESEICYKLAQQGFEQFKDPDTGAPLGGDDCVQALTDARATQNNLQGYLTYSISRLDNTIKAEHLIQIGTLAIMPYVGELVLESGLVTATATLLYQFIAGSFMFFVFKQQTTSWYFYDDIIYGGALYIATGRGFSITHSKFVSIFKNYARTHLLPAAQYIMLLITLLVSAKQADYGNYIATTWGIWLVALSLGFAPFWFNPMTFSLSKVIRDYRAWSGWMRGEVDPATNSTWYTWNEAQLTKHRNERRNQTDHWMNVFRDGFLGAIPDCLLIVAAMTRMQTNSIHGFKNKFLTNRYIVFAIATALLWGIGWLLMRARKRYKSNAMTRGKRMLDAFFFIFIITIIVVYIVFSVEVFKAPSAVGTAALVIFANFELIVVLHRIMLYTCVDNLQRRQFVDWGYRTIDYFLGYVTLGILCVLSFVGITARVQAALLFNPTFAKSVKRGKIVKTIGVNKAEPIKDILDYPTKVPSKKA